MPKPVRLQLSRRKGFDLQALSMATNGLPAVNVARPTKWGNPWVVVNEDNANLWIANAKTFELIELVPDGADPHTFLVDYFRQRAVDALPNLTPLRGKNAACFCGAGEPCHADVLLELANQEQRHA